MALYRHKMERQLRESEQWLATTVNSIGDGVITIDAEGRIKLANPVATAYLAALTQAGVGEVLTRLGPRSLRELLKPPPSGLAFHEIVLEGPPQQLFEVTAQSMKAGSQISGWVLCNSGCNLETSH